MDIETFRDYCLALPGSHEKMPFEKFFRGRHAILAFYVGHRIFCFTDIDRFEACTVKCPPEQIAELEARYTAVGRPYNLNARYWVNLGLGGDLPDDEVRRLVRQSYQLVRDSLPRHERPAP